MSLAEYALGQDLGIDQIVFADGFSHTGHPGRMAELTSVCLLLVTLARLGVLLGRTSLASGAATVALSISVWVGLGYVYGVPSLYRIGPFSTMAFNSALAGLALSLSTLALMPGRVVERLLWARTPGALLLRRLLPLGIVGLPVLGYLRLEGQRLGWYGTELGLAIMVLVAMLTLSIVTIRSAAYIDRADSVRRGALADLNALNLVLETRIVDRSERLAAEQSRAAVLEDRNRIAAELHHRVGEKIFAEGLALEGVAARLPEGEARRQIRVSVGDLDRLVRELRQTVFSFAQVPVPASVGMRRAVLLVVERATGVLGFEPTVSLTGGVDELPDRVGDDLLAVLQESLSNVARHAGASHVHVSVDADEELEVIVTDDGRGLRGANVDSSGTRNLARRARLHGGRIAWTAVVPHGTSVRWVIPLAAESSGSPGAVLARRN